MTWERGKKVIRCTDQINNACENRRQSLCFKVKSKEFPTGKLAKDGSNEISRFL